MAPKLQALKLYYLLKCFKEREETQPKPMWMSSSTGWGEQPRAPSVTAVMSCAVGCGTQPGTAEW